VSPQRLLLVRLVSGLGAVALVVGLLLRFTGGATADGPVADQASPGPVLLIPGYGGGSGGLTTLRDQLEAAGRTATIVSLPGDGTGDLAKQADALGAQVDQALTTGARSVDLIGYSAGGVVARLYVAHGGHDRVRRVITLGSPHHGTQVAALAATFASGACPEACQQLVPGSHVLRALADSPPGPTWLSLWTSDDEVVTPPSSARLKGALDAVLQDVCPGTHLSHDQLPDAPLVTAIVVRELTASAMSAPSGC
jgi:triacylglycerol lipase